MLASAADFCPGADAAGLVLGLAGFPGTTLPPASSITSHVILQTQLHVWFAVWFCFAVLAEYDQLLLLMMLFKLSIWG